jgi:hypothetical protein
MPRMFCGVTSRRRCVSTLRTNIAGRRSVRGFSAARKSKIEAALANHHGCAFSYPARALQDSGRYSDFTPPHSRVATSHPLWRVETDSGIRGIRRPNFRNHDFFLCCLTISWRHERAVCCCGHRIHSSTRIHRVSRQSPMVVKKEPNKAPEPTSGIVTPRAKPRVAPVPPVAHL